jgi:hypothetical protein
MVGPPSRRSPLLACAKIPSSAMRGGRLFAAPAPVSTAPPFPAAPSVENPKLLVAGPADGILNHWADALLPAFEQSLPPDTSIRRVEIGSTDGVTGANQFEARGVPDGQTVLLAPGRAALAWMVGDPRAKFDVAHWVPVVAGASTGLVVGRPAVLDPDGHARIGAASPAGSDLAALLGLYLLGVRMEVALGLVEPGAPEKAFMQGAADAVLLHGQRVPERFSALRAAGAQPLFTLGMLDDTGRLVRDAAYPQVPHFTELYAMRTGGLLNAPLYEAWCAAAAAAQLEFGMVLPQLTPAALVALWRHAGSDAVASLGVQTVAASVNVRPWAGPIATTSTSAIAASAPALQELRGWLADRLNWRPV